jgi:acetyl-CoA C-acetyltransferase
MSIDPRTPCIIGVAQRTVRRGESSLEPLELWAEVARAAADDAGTTSDVLAAVDRLELAFCHSWRYDDPMQRLSERLGIDPQVRSYSGISGTSGLTMLSEAAESIMSGDHELALLCGGEALSSFRAAAKSGEQPAWSYPHPEGSFYFPHVELHPGEVATGVVTNAPFGFSLFDSARRARLGTGLEEYRHELCELFAPMTEVASRNPHAWFQTPHDPEFLQTVTTDNRMVAYPYTKHVVSIMDIDMGAAVMVASAACADRLGVPAERRVYLHGWCAATSPERAAENDDLGVNPAMRAASTEALACAGLAMDDIAHLDVYSCFGSAVNLAREALGIESRQGQELTVTGGLPYAGGPGSSYVLNSLAAMTDVLRADPSSFGMVTGVGMLMSKHAYGVLGATPPATLPRMPRQADIQAELDALPTRTIVDNYTGPATVVAYSVAHDRSGPAFGAAVCELPDGRRAYARFDQPDLLASVETSEFVGTKVQLSGAGEASTLEVG